MNLVNLSIHSTPYILYVSVAQILYQEFDLFCQGDLIWEFEKYVLVLKGDKGGFFSERANAFVISPNKQT